MKITFEEYLKSFDNSPDFCKPTLEEYEQIQDECLIIEFLGYEERPDAILKSWDEQGDSWDEQGDSWDEQKLPYGLYSTINRENGIYYEHDDVLIIEDFKLKSWDMLMQIFWKIANYKPEQMTRFELDKNTFFWEFVIDGKICHSYNSYHPDNLEMSNASSYEEMIYKGCLDFVKLMKDYDT